MTTAVPQRTATPPATTNPPPHEMKLPLKDGIKTTEFWLTSLGVLVTAALTILEQLNTGWAIAAITVLTALYNLLRFAGKSSPKP